MTIHTAIPDYAAARAAMIDSQLRPEGVGDLGVLAAMAAVPRERFVPEAARAVAYGDRAVPLGEGRSLMAPAALGLLLNALAPRSGERALVVGASSGYSVALLARIGLDVTALESSAALAAAARGQRIAVIEGPLAAGHARGAPYDLILIDGAVAQVPPALIDQLADGGRLGAALSERGVTRLVAARKAGGGFGLHSIADAGVAALPGFARPAEFTF